MTTTKKNGNMVAIITMFFIFAMISFVTNMAAPFGTIWGYTYEWAGMMGNMMNFAAYLFMGIPAGKMLISVGYKKTSLIALAVGFIVLRTLLTSEFGMSIPEIQVLLECTLHNDGLLLQATGKYHQQHQNNGNYYGQYRRNIEKALDDE